MRRRRHGAGAAGREAAGHRLPRHPHARHQWHRSGARVVRAEPAYPGGVRDRLRSIRHRRLRAGRDGLPAEAGQRRAVAGDPRSHSGAAAIDAAGRCRAGAPAAAIGPIAGRRGAPAAGLDHRQQRPRDAADHAGGRGLRPCRQQVAHRGHRRRRGLCALRQHRGQTFRPVPHAGGGLCRGGGSGRCDRRGAQPPERRRGGGRRGPCHVRGQWTPLAHRQRGPAGWRGAYVPRHPDHRAVRLCGATGGPSVRPRHPRLLQPGAGFLRARARHHAQPVRARRQLVGQRPGPLQPGPPARRRLRTDRWHPAPRRHDPDAGPFAGSAPRWRLPGRRPDAAPPVRSAV
ncbi:hypothetical protein G6F64_013284 [Rhizopus arrhizus]|uniref:Uncharacterized protein n=1 Tax=Rhizopus oryzae TaxID=64495 RepID=A0A9P6WVS3_RHIOR|nr:hypothetical protein G6F64_013284 [Rhizopus arrhizus]